MALLSNQPRTATVTAITPLRLLVIADRAFVDLLDAMPELWLKVARSLAERVSGRRRRSLAPPSARTACRARGSVRPGDACRLVATGGVEAPRPCLQERPGSLSHSLDAHQPTDLRRRSIQVAAHEFTRISMRQSSLQPDRPYGRPGGNAAPRRARARRRWTRVLRQYLSRPLWRDRGHRRGLRRFSSRPSSIAPQMSRPIQTRTAAIDMIPATTKTASCACPTRSQAPHHLVSRLERCPARVARLW